MITSSQGLVGLPTACARRGASIAPLAAPCCGAGAGAQAVQSRGRASRRRPAGWARRRRAAADLSPRRAGEGAAERRAPRTPGAAFKGAAAAEARRQLGRLPSPTPLRNAGGAAPRLPARSPPAPRGPAAGTATDGRGRACPGGPSGGLRCAPSGSPLPHEAPVSRVSASRQALECGDKCPRSLASRWERSGSTWHPAWRGTAMLCAVL